MFPGQEEATATTSAESKYVANLSTMSNGDPATSSSYPTMPNFLNPMSSGAGTSTPTLTPTSLASLEQTFIELQSVPPHHHGNNNGHNNNGSNGAGAGVNSNNNNIGGCDPHTQSGFVPPVVDPSSREQSQDSFESDPEWEPVLKRGRGGGGGGLVMGGGEGEDSPGGGGGGHHQANGGSQRKYTRRSRNEKLSPEEEERRKVRRERNKLAAAKCRQRRVDHTNALVEETEKLEAEKSDLENEIQSLQQQKDQLEFLLQAHVPLCKVDPGAATIKIEPSEGSCLGTASRPTSLALDRPQQNGGLPELGVTCAPPGHGVSLSTPSSGMYSYTDLDSLVDGPSGLTPLTSGPAVSCSNQLHRIESDSGPEGVGKGKVLVQL